MKQITINKMRKGINVKIIPAIDIKGGRCVRLFQGRMDHETVYSENPVETAMMWQEQGAQMLHIVDLDGAVTGKPVNFSIIEKIIKSIAIKVQVGGGIRDKATVDQYMSAGAGRIIIGTAAASNLEFVLSITGFYTARIVIGLDARDGMVAVKGWTETTKIDAIDLAMKFEGIGIGAIIFTDINRDGTLTGPNLKNIEMFSSSVRIPVIASGGVSSIDDIKALRRIAHPGLDGVIVGKALYSGAVDLAEAIKTAA